MEGSFRLTAEFENINIEKRSDLDTWSFTENAISMKSLRALQLNLPGQNGRNFVEDDQEHFSLQSEEPTE